MSDPAVLVAIIAAIPVTLGLFGRAVWTIVTTILDAYKRQAEATITAKDADLAAKDREIDRLRDGVGSELSDLRRDVQELNLLLREWSR